MAFNAACDCGAGEAPAVAHREECEVLQCLWEALCDCQGEADDFDSHAEDCPYLEYLMASAEYMSEQTMTLAYTLSGTKLTAASGWTTISKSTVLDSSYLPLNFYSGVSSAASIGSASGWTTNSVSNGNAFYWYPKSNSAAKGSHGCLYSKVLFDNGQWYDLRITDWYWTTSQQYKDKSANVRPFAGFYTNKIQFMFWRGGDFFLKCQFVTNGTTTPVQKKVRIGLYDIDGAQRMYFKNIDGTIDHRYCYSDTIVHVENKTINGVSLQKLAAEDVKTSNDDTAGYAVYDINATGFYFGMNHDDNETVNAAAVTGHSLYGTDGSLANGNVIGVYSIAGIRSGTPSPTAVPAPEKSVSTDGKTWSTSNTLTSITGQYWYRIQQRVPAELAANYYSSFSIKDALPAGVDYVSSVKVICMETGADVSSRFTITTSGDVITATATASAMASARFYELTYRLEFKVQMDPSEISPSYSGTKAVYTVRNTASRTVKHKSDASSSTANTNTVTTTASVSRATPASPVKRLDANMSLTTKRLASLNEEIVFSIFQTTPVNAAATAPSQIKMTDVLDNALEYQSVTVYSRKAGATTYTEDKSWTAAVSRQTVTASRAWSLTEAYDLRFDIRCRIREGYDLSSYLVQLDGGNWDKIDNTAKMTFSYALGSPASVEKTTNVVSVYAPTWETDVFVVKTNEVTGENISNAEFRVYEWNGDSYSIDRGTMTYRALRNIYEMTGLNKTATNGGRYKIVETGTPYGHTGSWSREFTVGEDLELTFRVTNPMSTGTFTITKTSEKGEFLAGAVIEIRAKEDINSPQGQVLAAAGTLVDTVTTGADGKAVSKQLYPGTYLLTEIKAPEGYALNTEPQEAVIVYKDADTPVTNTDVIFTNPRLYSTLRLTKEIDAEDIVWAHGNPTFTFRVEGTDLLGERHTYYETVEFTEGMETGGGKIRLTADFRVLAGSYVASETDVIRYRLENIYEVSNGTVSGSTVEFDLGGKRDGTDTEGPSGNATFYNVKTTDEGLSHTAFVRNTIVPAE